MKIPYEELMQDLKMFYKTWGHKFRIKGNVSLTSSQKQCVFGSYFYFNLSSSWSIIVFVEVALTPASQDIEVQVKRRDFTDASASNNAVVCDLEITLDRKIIFSICISPHEVSGRGILQVTTRTHYRLSSTTPAPLSRSLQRINKMRLLACI